jgi:hypothetical protein
VIDFIDESGFQSVAKSKNIHITSLEKKKNYYSVRVSNPSGTSIGGFIVKKKRGKFLPIENLSHPLTTFRD